MLVYCRFFKKILVQQLQDGGLNLQPLEIVCMHTAMSSSF